MMKATVLLTVLSYAQDYQAFRHFEKMAIKSLNSGDVVHPDKYLEYGGESLKLGNDNVRSGDEDIDNEGTLKKHMFCKLKNVLNIVSCFYC